HPDPPNINHCSAFIASKSLHLLGAPSCLFRSARNCPIRPKSSTCPAHHGENIPDLGCHSNRKPLAETTRYVMTMLEQWTDLHDAVLESFELRWKSGELILRIRRRD